MPFDFAKKMGTCSFFVAVESNPDRNSNHRLKCDWEVTWRWVKTDLIWLTSDECIVRSRSDRLLPAALLPPLLAAAMSDFAISRGAARLCRMSVIQSDTQTQHFTWCFVSANVNYFQNILTSTFRDKILYANKTFHLLYSGTALDGWSCSLLLHSSHGGIATWSNTVPTGLAIQPCCRNATDLVNKYWHTSQYCAMWFHRWSR